MATIITGWPFLKSRLFLCCFDIIVFMFQHVSTDVFNNHGYFQDESTYITHNLFSPALNHSTDTILSDYPKITWSKCRDFCKSGVYQLKFRVYLALDFINSLLKGKICFAHLIGNNMKFTNKILWKNQKTLSFSGRQLTIIFSQCSVCD